MDNREQIAWILFSFTLITALFCGYKWRTTPPQRIEVEREVVRKEIVEVPREVIREVPADTSEFKKKIADLEAALKKAGTHQKRETALTLAEDRTEPAPSINVEQMLLLDKERVFQWYPESKTVLKQPFETYLKSNDWVRKVRASAPGVNAALLAFYMVSYDDVRKMNMELLQENDMLLQDLDATKALVHKERMKRVQDVAQAQARENQARRAEVEARLRAAEQAARADVAIGEAAARATPRQSTAVSTNVIVVNEVNPITQPEAQAQSSAERSNQMIRAQQQALYEKQQARRAGLIAPDPSTYAGFKLTEP